MAFPALDALLAEPAHGLAPAEKDAKFMEAMREVTRFHIDHCPPYARMCAKRGFDVEAAATAADIPYVPTALFKNGLLLSVPADAVFREVRSSATSSGTSSRMGLDRETNLRQSKCFNKSVTDRIGNRRFHFIVLDEPSSIARSAVITARSSTIRSLLFCAKDAETVLVERDGRLALDLPKLEALLSAHEAHPADLVIFGFTFILYTEVVKPLLEAGRRFNLAGAKVIHIGGWKKLEAQKVTPEQLIADCGTVFGVAPSDVVDLYGFTEQGGVIYPTCEAGVRHLPAWAHLVVRDPATLESLPPGRDGLLQFLTPIQTSYPGHSVLTEDVGHLIALDGCGCGRRGPTFRVVGRALNAEVRGCGDIMAEKFA